MLTNIEKIFRKRLSNKQSSKGIDHDELWGAIAGGIETNPPAKGLFDVKKLLPLLLLLIGFGAGYLYFANEAETPQREVTKTSKIMANHQTNTENLIDKKIESQKKAVEIHQTNTENLIDKKVKSQKKAIVSDQSRAATDNAPRPIIIEDYTSKANITVEKQQPEITEKQPEVIHPFTTSTQKKITNSTAIRPIAIWSPPAFDIPASHQETIKYLLPKASKQNKSTKLPLEFSIYSGVNTLSVITKDGNNREFAKSLTSATSNNIGTFSGFGVTYFINDKYTVTTGLSYETTRTIFEFTSSEEKIQWVPQRQEMMPVLIERHVLHHNTFTSISIPLEFGIRKQLGNWYLGVNTGLSYNLFLTQEGRSIDSDLEIRDFNNTTQPFKKSFFAFRLNPFVDLKMNERFSIRINPTIKYQLHGTSDLYGANQRSLLMGIRGGLVVKM